MSRSHVSHPAKAEVSARDRAEVLAQRDSHRHAKQAGNGVEVPDDSAKLGIALHRGVVGGLLVALLAGILAIVHASVDLDLRR